MALAATTIYECNASATAGNINGGGFNPANTNTINDGVISTGNTASPTLSSATYTFVASDVGAWVYFPTQTSMINCFAKIAGVSGGVATLTAGTSTLNLNTVPDWTTNTSTAGVATTGSVSSVKFLVDYSRSTASKQSWSNLSSATTTLTDASSGGFFTPAMAGNLICLSSGTSLTVGWYEIVSYTSTNIVVLDRTPGTISASTGNVGGAISLNGSTTGITDSSFFGLAGNSTTASKQVFILNGSYTFAVAPSLAAGNAAFAARVSGYASIRGDSPTGSTRPTINCATFTVSLGGNLIFKNIILNGTATSLVSLISAYITVKECSIFNKSTAGNHACIAVGSNNFCYIYKNELCSYAGFGLSVSAFGNYFLYNYIHDSLDGITDSTNTGGNTIIGNLIIGVIGTAILFGSSGYTGTICGNTLYGMPTPLGGSNGITLNFASDSLLCNNNIIANFAIGAEGTAVSPNILADFNNYYGNTTNTSVWNEGPNTQFNNPSFTNVFGVSKIGTCTTSGTTLTDSGQNFTTAGVVAGRDYVYVSANTGGSTGIFGITAVGTTTLTTDNTLGAGSSTVYQILAGRNFLPTGSV